MDNGIGNWPTLHRVRHPHRVALIDGVTGAEYTFEQLDLRTNALAAALRVRGVGKGDRVALVTLNSPHMLEVMFAVAKLGAVAVPINWRLQAPEVNYILRDSGARLAFVSPQTAALARAAAEDTEVSELIEIPSGDQRAAGDASEYEDLIAAADTERVVVDVDADDLSMLMYTSGTTGFPKGAMLTHANHHWNGINNLTAGDGVGPRDVNIASAPLFHIGALGVITLPLLYIGGTTVVLETFTPDAWLAAVEKHGVTVAFAVPAMWAAIDASPAIATADLSSLRFGISGGAPCPVVLIESLNAHGVRFCEGFGLTETAPNVCVLAVEEAIEYAGSVGKPVLHVEMKVADDGGREVAPGVIGELLVRGPNVFVGYWNKPEATAEALRDGWFHTGDLATCDEEGYYRIVDRKKDMIVTGGENVYASEVEQAMYRHPAVAEVAVIGLPDEKWGESVTAVVATKPGADVSEGDLIAWTREQIAHFKSPRAVHFVEALPRTATGKVLKRDLRLQWTGDGSAVHR
ncbi:acyl-CoA synthetase [Gordonia neofelifaecis]|uniref:O-succinylbenzoate-CoA ligase n=1 Tax=Gordonia neofelifaecis NRRL B-59395 TaxID=644548 RepID=F1YEE5_9ACTN|nr:long-chain fatty acid--CoA ligase [Gordonia neofelifaecis]EGD56778.1 O-succinylbenzoate-CoA ligase [Gordonia neofelifaecis NRRL B-59395]